MKILRKNTANSFYITALIFVFIINAFFIYQISHKTSSLIDSDYEEELFVRDIQIAIKTCTKYHHTKLQNVLDTWYEFARESTYAISDSFDADVNKAFDGKLIASSCDVLHSRGGMCCKFATGVSLFYKSNKAYKWSCAFDDDTFVNIPNLVATLAKFDHTKSFYIGKLAHLDKKQKYEKYLEDEGITIYYKHASLGGGVCLSKGLLDRIKNDTEPKTFEDACFKYGLEDDQYLGLLLKWKHNTSLTDVTTFNHHYDEKEFEDLTKVFDQVTYELGNAYFRRNRNLGIPGFKNLYPPEEDPLKMKTLHCLNFPETNDCKQRILNALIKFEVLEKEINTKPENTTTSASKLKKRDSQSTTKREPINSTKA